MQTFLAAISPPQGEGLGRYLDAVARVLGVQSDAALARIIEVSPGVVASWRRRKVVGGAGARWFQHQLLKHACQKQEYRFTASFEEMTVVEVLRRTGVNPLNMHPPNNVLTCEAIPPLLTLAYIIFNGPLHDELDADERREHCAADLLMEALPMLRKRLGLGTTPLPEGAQ